MHVSGYSWIELEPIGHMLLVVFLSATQNPPLTSKGFPAHGTRIVAGLVQSTTSSSTHDHPTTRKQLTAYLHTTDTPIYMKICSMGADAQQRLRQEKQEELRFRLPLSQSLVHPPVSCRQKINRTPDSARPCPRRPNRWRENMTVTFYRYFLYSSSTRSTNCGFPMMIGQRSWMSLGAMSSTRPMEPLNMPVEAIPPACSMMSAIGNPS